MEMPAPPVVLSVGSLVKKIMEVNPNLSAPDVIAVVKAATRADGKAVDEALALELAKKV